MSGLIGRAPLRGIQRAGFARALALAALVPGLLMSGCADHGYRCPEPLACAPVHDNYEAAISDPSEVGWKAGDPYPDDEGDDIARARAHADAWRHQHQGDAAQADGLPPSDGGDAPAAPPHTPHAAAPLPASRQDAVDGPMYEPPRPWMMWLAPWRHDNGTLESGRYIWFTTPGHWVYLGQTWEAVDTLTTSMSRDDDGVLHPVRPDQLGFKPGKAVAPQGVIDSMVQPQADAPKN